MATKPMKTLKLPGLADTYTFVQADSTLSVSGEAADAKATGDALAAVNEAAEAEIRKLRAQVEELQATVAATSPLEYLAQKYGNVVKYDENGGIAGIFVKFPKMKSSELVAGLPDHTHPAFIINGVEVDYILLGQYKGGVNGVSGGALLSLPNLRPANSLTADSFLSRMKLAGPGITGMTCADYGFIKLLAQKHGWKPEGNTNWGVYHNRAVWKTGLNVALNEERAFRGWIYTCLQAHTTTAELRPDTAPAYWERGAFVGGIDSGSMAEAEHLCDYSTLSGSGPISWYLGGDPGLLADIIGSALEQQYGYRIVDCELQILENNDAADPDADLSAASAAWRAILPNAGDNGYTLVAPGTAGTLHWNWLNGHITLDTQCDDLTIGAKNENFTAVAVNSERLPYVPSIVYELGLIKTGADDDTPGKYYINFGEGEFAPRRGGSYNYGSNAGLGCVYAYDGRSSARRYCGCRPRSL